MVAPPQGIDRDALNRVLEEFSLLGLDEKSADRILALVRPVEGVVLTPEEVRIVRWLLMFWGVDDKRERAATPPSRESINALAARLEAAQ